MTDTRRPRPSGVAISLQQARDHASVGSAPGAAALRRLRGCSRARRVAISWSRWAGSSRVSIRLCNRSAGPGAVPAAGGRRAAAAAAVATTAVGAGRARAAAGASAAAPRGRAGRDGDSVATPGLGSRRRPIPRIPSYAPASLSDRPMARAVKRVPAGARRHQSPEPGPDARGGLAAVTPGGELDPARRPARAIPAPRAAASAPSARRWRRCSRDRRAAAASRAPRGSWRLSATSAGGSPGRRGPSSIGKSTPVTRRAVSSTSRTRAVAVAAIGHQRGAAPLEMVERRRWARARSSTWT